MGPRPDAEVISDGRGEALGAEMWTRLRARPRLLAAVLTAVVVAVVGGAVVSAPKWLPDLPTPRVTFIADDLPVDVDPWQADADGRPAGPVVLPIAVSSRRADREPVDVHLLGLSGPGVSGSDSPPFPLRPGVAVQSRLRVVLDCEAVLAAGPAPGSLGLLIRISSDGRHRDVVLPAPAGSDSWTSAAHLACASWAARRDLTVTAVTARVHPTLTNVALTVTVADTGDRPAVLVGAVPVRDEVRLTGALPVRVPPGGSVTIERTAVLDLCDSATTVPDGAVPDGPGTAAGTAATTALINLSALSGESEPVGVEPWFGGGEGRGPTGVVLAPAARAALTSAFRQACGGVGPLVTLLSPDGLRYDRGRRELTVPLVVDVTPGKVRSLDLQPTIQPGEPDAFAPLWTTGPGLVPDATGQVRLTVRYRAPSTGSCPARGAHLPGVVADLHVAAVGGERVVRLSGLVDLASEPRAVALLCPDPP
jgi:hypothetical protein